jgi:hypothetical protein
LTTQVAVFSVTLASSAAVRAILPATKNLQESKQKMRLRQLLSQPHLQLNSGYSP